MLLNIDSNTTRQADKLFFIVAFVLGLIAWVLIAVFSEQFAYSRWFGAPMAIMPCWVPACLAAIGAIFYAIKHPTFGKMVSVCSFAISLAVLLTVAMG